MTIMSNPISQPMVRPSICKAHVLNFFDPVFTGFPALDIEVKVNSLGLPLGQVTHNMACVEPFAGTFHFSVTGLWFMPTVGLVAMGDEILVFDVLLDI